MGRGTYDKVLEFDPWAYPEKRVIVMTHKPLKNRDERVELSGLGPVEMAAVLRAERCRNVDSCIVGERRSAFRSTAVRHTSKAHQYPELGEWLCAVTLRSGSELKASK